MAVQLPGHARQPGLWPAAWIFGNLGRATLINSTEKLWPWSYNHCPAPEDEAANQNVREQQLINACMGPEDTAKYGLNPRQVDPLVSRLVRPRALLGTVPSASPRFDFLSWCLFCPRIPPSPSGGFCLIFSLPHRTPSPSPSLSLSPQNRLPHSPPHATRLAHRSPPTNHQHLRCPDDFPPPPSPPPCPEPLPQGMRVDDAPQVARFLCSQGHGRAPTRDHFSIKKRC